MNNKFKVVAKEGLNVRSVPGSTGNKLGRLPYGVFVDIVDFTEGQLILNRETGVQTRTWAKITIEIELGNVVVDTKYGYVSMAYISDQTNVEPPPPTTTGSIIGKHPALKTLTQGQKFGLHVFNRVDVAKIRFKEGCRLFTVMDNIQGMRELIAMGASGAHRRFQRGVIEPHKHADMMGLSRDDTFMVLGRNEQDNDQDFGGSFQDHMDRVTWQAQWDLAFCQRIWEIAPNCLPTVPNLAMGNPPQLENERMWRHYGEQYKWINDNRHRVVFGYHMYDKKWALDAPDGGQNRPYDPPTYYSMRMFEFLKKNKMLHEDVVMFGDEGFIDFEGGGGSDWAGYGSRPGYTKKWFRESGVFAQPSLYGVTGFHGVDGSERQEWRQYSMVPVMGEMIEIWTGRA